MDPEPTAPRSGGRPSRTLRRGAAAAVVVLIVAIGAVVASSARDGGPSDVPAYAQSELTLFSGAQLTLAELRGRPVVVNFFASWCPPCVAEMPDFEAVHQRRGDAVAFVGLALQDTRASAEALVALTGVSYPVAEDPGGLLYREFEGIAMPTTVFLDAEGRLVDRHSGILSQAQLEERIDQLLQEG